MSIFVIDKLVKGIAPETLENASNIATEILRSDVYQTVVCGMYGSPAHIDPQKLQSVLAQSKFISLDRLRGFGILNARACTMRQYDPWRLYLNPLLLLELGDLEREYHEITTALPSDPSRDLISVVPPFTDKQQTVLGKRDTFNSLLYADQLLTSKAELKEPAKKKPKRMAASSSSSSSSSTATTTPSTTAPSNLASSGPSGAVPSSTSNPPTMSILEKHTLFLVILLIHEVSHLLNYALSNAMDRTKPVAITPFNKYIKNQPSGGKYTATLIKDFGHMVEKELFGYVIQHSVRKSFPTPFGVDKIIGCDREGVDDGVELYPSQELSRFLQGEKIAIAADMLTLVEGPEFAGESAVLSLKSLRASSGGLIEKDKDYVSDDEFTSAGLMKDLSKYMRD